MASSPGIPAIVAQARYLVGTLTLSSLFFFPSSYESIYEQILFFFFPRSIPIRGIPTENKPSVLNWSTRMYEQCKT
ncbi:hypothetical protein F4811DRAFT_519117 [Daldinia bambusicola]|nr:hypothetical protein F4811DRAFT_519117 [Daldinia bambusicola]